MTIWFLTPINLDTCLLIIRFSTSYTFDDVLQHSLQPWYYFIHKPVLERPLQLHIIQSFLLRCTFSQSINSSTKRTLYIALVRSQLLYCSPLWHPYLIQDISVLERIQRRATKFILNDYISDYKTRFIKLNLLPLM